MKHTESTRVFLDYINTEDGSGLNIFIKGYRDTPQKSQ